MNKSSDNSYTSSIFTNTSTITSDSTVSTPNSKLSTTSAKPEMSSLKPNFVPIKSIDINDSDSDHKIELDEKNSFPKWVVGPSLSDQQRVKQQQLYQSYLKKMEKSAKEEKKILNKISKTHNETNQKISTKHVRISSKEKVSKDITDEKLDNVNKLSSPKTIKRSIATNDQSNYNSNNISNNPPFANRSIKDISDKPSDKVQNKPRPKIPPKPRNIPKPKNVQHVPVKVINSTQKDSPKIDDEPSKNLEISMGHKKDLSFISKADVNLDKPCVSSQSINTFITCSSDMINITTISNSAPNHNTTSPSSMNSMKTQWKTVSSELSNLFDIQKDETSLISDDFNNMETINLSRPESEKSDSLTSLNIKEDLSKMPIMNIKNYSYTLPRRVTDLKIDHMNMMNTQNFFNYSSSENIQESLPIMGPGSFFDNSSIAEFNPEFSSLTETEFRSLPPMSFDQNDQVFDLTESNDKSRRNSVIEKDVDEYSKTIKDQRQHRVSFSMDDTIVREKDYETDSPPIHKKSHSRHKHHHHHHHHHNHHNHHTHQKISSQSSKQKKCYHENTSFRSLENSPTKYPSLTSDFSSLPSYQATNIEAIQPPYEFRIKSPEEAKHTETSNYKPINPCHKVFCAFSSNSESKNIASNRIDSGRPSHHYCSTHKHSTHSIPSHPNPCCGAAPSSITRPVPIGMPSTKSPSLSYIPDSESAPICSLQKQHHCHSSQWSLTPHTSFSYSPSSSIPSRSHLCSPSGMAMPTSQFCYSNSEATQNFHTCTSSRAPVQRYHSCSHHEGLHEKSPHVCSSSISLPRSSHVCKNHGYPRQRSLGHIGQEPSTPCSSCHHKVHRHHGRSSKHEKTRRI